MSEKKDPEEGAVGEENQTERFEIPAELPILPVRNTVLYPSMVLPLMVARGKSVKLIDSVLSGNRLLGIVAQRDPAIEDPSAEDMFEHGSVGTILKMLKFPDESIRVLVRGIQRIRIKQFVSTDPFFRAAIEVREASPVSGVKLEALVQSIRQQFAKLIENSPILPRETQVAAQNIDDPGMLADFVATNLNLKLEDMQDILECIEVPQRLEKVAKLLSREIQVAELGSKIQDEIKSQIDQSQREYYLRQQMKAIKKELGEDDTNSRDIEELRKRIEDAGMPDEPRKEAEKELGRLSRMHPESAEYTVARTYLDWLCELPWSKSTPDNLDIPNVRKTLNEDHYGLDKPKERILEYLAVRKLKNDMKGPILCFVGPPGVGKTSLGRSIARAMGRKFERMSLGGVRDEAEIRGHRRTYVGALPGRIIRSMRKVGSHNPLIMLDEIDKLGADFRGDPSSALLEVLDPEQNNSFTDHYLDLPFDLSKVLFITTANLLDPIPGPLRDRMEVLEIPGYILEEKVEIAKRHILPKQLEAHGITKEHIEFTDGSIVKLVDEFTREAGVRNLEREVANICRKVAMKVAVGDTAKAVIQPDDVNGFLGPQKFFSELAERTDIPGVAIGLAWTAVGGEILFIEATKMAGGKRLSITGKLGEVMQESAQTAFSYIRSRATELGIPDDFYEQYDIHVHIPAGAIPKDGPSAGITIATAIASLLTRRPVVSDLAMTGEITLRGKVLPVGGIKEKVLAAARSGLNRIILPARNEKDLFDVPAEVKSKLKFIFVDSVEKVFDVTLGPKLPEPVKSDPGKAEDKGPKGEEPKPAGKPKSPRAQTRPTDRN
ncbi:MAG TPA: endopeptidase La [Myxococcota bacterium]|nr:endopeptidase La [Myxococcota bacterium]HRY92289.1 endopeptidase La [Myxococcota bacterium]